MITTIDLFAGAGGLSYGFLMTGKYQFVAAAEINENARKTYKKNIVGDREDFEFIENVVGYDFGTLNTQFDGDIDVVIGGPPCQGFSNANRQKNHLISMNNGLVKEYFRAIKQIRPKAFVMENVSMLESETHRFYESTRDNDEIDALIAQGHDIPKREDSLLLSKESYTGIDMLELPTMDLRELMLPEKLAHLLSVLKKNIGNDRRLPNFLKKNTRDITRLITAYVKEVDEAPTDKKCLICDCLKDINEAIKANEPDNAKTQLDYIVGLQKLIGYIREISDNGLIGQYEYSEMEGLRFVVNSYSVIDYVKAILGDDYIQEGSTVNAEWFGVPQERRRYIVIGIRKDIYKNANIDIELPKEPQKLHFTLVEDAIKDLEAYEVAYETDAPPQPYVEQENLSDYAKKMRADSDSVKNHIVTKTTDKALERFKKIEQGKNFHSLDVEDKDTYAKPERTQNTIYLRLDPKSPSGTVVNVRKSMWIHPTFDRAISVREAARLQSFPDNFEFVGSKDSQYQQVGNAVPPLLAQAIAETLLRYIE